MDYSGSASATKYHLFNCLILFLSLVLGSPIDAH